MFVLSRNCIYGSGARYFSTPATTTDSIEAKERLRRSIFYVPGSDERKLKKSLGLAADCLVYDLEDSVSLNRKGTARELVLDTLEASEHRKAEKAVRINAIGSGLELDDLNVVLRSKRLEAIVIPKVQSAKDIQFVSQMIDTVAPEITRKDIRILASIESALGIMNMKEIATCDPRVDALVFAAEDFCADLQMIRTPSRLEMLYARSAVVTTAKAYNLQAIDLVCVDYENEKILQEECDEGREMGFTGKQAVHPKQVETIQRVFLPSHNEIERALKVMKGYVEFKEKGVGAFSLEGKMIDMPVVRWAQRLLIRAQKGGVLPEGEKVHEL
ncbi:beta subunit of citrate lyase [Basidiobolus meristosporus CBS 931.73]|uniref:Beta subunit of citrate lyase n=1 Tax=Basidiobolus meristosporus CBS 931.73 TaxID=1314790 RepID=A0A1Y1XBZ0_9FUNG|nr:beta subunit of citrate lyase [Basidiobolus meristosporus CBS 931.73]|eukprot:ORX82894.1 beta subunit of citrate lyase [Basidiobolus meristosporus CBS 931.73]